MQPSTSDPGRGYKDPSAAAVHAARAILRNYHVDALPPPRKSKWAPTERNLAIIIDVCTQVFRLEHTVNLICREINHADPNEFRRNIDDVREAMFLLERARNFLPLYSDEPVVEEQSEIITDAGAKQ